MDGVNQMKINYENLLMLCIERGIREGMNECMTSEEDVDDEIVISLIAENVIKQIKVFIDLQ